MSQSGLGSHPPCPDGWPARPGPTLECVFSRSGDEAGPALLRPLQGFREDR